MYAIQGNAYNTTQSIKIILLQNFCQRAREPLALFQDYDSNSLSVLHHKYVTCINVLHQSLDDLFKHSWFSQELGFVSYLSL